MGFFSELKEDLSQAVNELMPEDGTAEAEAVTEENAETVAEDEAETAETEGLTEGETWKMGEEKVTEEPEEVADLEAMLSKLDEGETSASKDDLEEILVALDIQTKDFTEKEENNRGERRMDAQYNTKDVSDETSVITNGMVITGDIISEGSVDVLGTINGNIDILGKLNITGSIQGNSKAAEIFADNAKISGEIVSDGSVKIGQSSVIIGNITAGSAVIAGAVKGDIDVHGPVVLDTSAIVMGNIKSKSVQINNGAVIEGMCSQCYADVSPTSFFEDLKPAKNK